MSTGRAAPSAHLRLSPGDVERITAAGEFGSWLLGKANDACSRLDAELVYNKSESDTLLRDLEGRFLALKAEADSTVASRDASSAALASSRECPPPLSPQPSLNTPPCRGHQCFACLSRPGAASRAALSHCRGGAGGGKGAGGSPAVAADDRRGAGSLGRVRAAGGVGGEGHGRGGAAMEADGARPRCGCVCALAVVRTTVAAMVVHACAAVWAGCSQGA